MEDLFNPTFYFDDDIVKEFVNIEKVDKDKVNPNLLNISKYKNPVEGDIYAIYSLDDGELVREVFGSYDINGFTSQLGREVIDKENCMTMNELSDYIEFSRYETIADFIIDYLKKNRGNENVQ